MNRFKPHVLVLPEDDANRQIANGFLLDLNLNARAIQVLPPAGGWQKVVNAFQTVHIHALQQYAGRRLILIIDFDEQHSERLNAVQNEIPLTVKDRVFILGVFSEPERLKSSAGMTFEEIGKALSKDCVDDTRNVWGHDLLKHNDRELDRLISSVKPFLFPYEGGTHSDSVS